MLLDLSKSNPEKWNSGPRSRPPEACQRGPRHRAHRRGGEKDPGKDGCRARMDALLLTPAKLKQVFTTI